jgi:acetoin utilization deacetylase AcuC-like enzyme
MNLDRESLFMTTLYVTHERYRDHKMQSYNHPEHPGRIEAVWKVLAEAGLTERMQTIEATPVNDQQILRVHTQDHLNALKMVSGQERMLMFDQDTYALPESPDIARLSAGGIVNAVDAVMMGVVDNALAAVRPPGHHSTPNRAMGFCILSNVAIAVRQAQVVYGIKRVMVVDYDVHHGNGTQDVFYEDGDVLFVSTHQYPFYPGTGAIKDTGAGAGKGATLNVPLRAGHGDSSYKAIFEKVLWPAARRFKPELIIVSAGFDAHHVDPIAMMALSHTGYATLSRELKAMAEELCGGKIIFAMEGGYDVMALAHGMRNIAHILLDEDEISDIYGKAGEIEPDIAPMIEQLQSLHGL